MFSRNPTLASISAWHNGLDHQSSWNTIAHPLWRITLVWKVGGTKLEVYLWSVGSVLTPKSGRLDPIPPEIDEHIFKTHSVHFWSEWVLECVSTINADGWSKLTPKLTQSKNGLSEFWKFALQLRLCVSVLSCCCTSSPTGLSAEQTDRVPAVSNSNFHKGMGPWTDYESLGPSLSRVQGRSP